MGSRDWDGKKEREGLKSKRPVVTDDEEFVVVEDGDRESEEEKVGGTEWKKDLILANADEEKGFVEFLKTNSITPYECEVTLKEEIRGTIREDLQSVIGLLNMLTEDEPSLVAVNFLVQRGCDPSVFGYLVYKDKDGNVIYSKNQKNVDKGKIEQLAKEMESQVGNYDENGMSDDLRRFLGDNLENKNNKAIGGDGANSDDNEKKRRKAKIDEWNAVRGDRSRRIREFVVGSGETPEPKEKRFVKPKEMSDKQWETEKLKTLYGESNGINVLEKAIVEPDRETKEESINRLEYLASEEFLNDLRIIYLEPFNDPTKQRRLRDERSRVLWKWGKLDGGRILRFRIPIKNGDIDFERGRKFIERIGEFMNDGDANKDFKKDLDDSNINIEELGEARQRLRKLGEQGEEEKVNPELEPEPAKSEEKNESKELILDMDVVRLIADRNGPKYVWDELHKRGFYMRPRISDEEDNKVWADVEILMGSDESKKAEAWKRLREYFRVESGGNGYIWGHPSGVETKIEPKPVSEERSVQDIQKEYVDMPEEDLFERYEKLASSGGGKGERGWNDELKKIMKSTGLDRENMIFDLRATLMLIDHPRTRLIEDSENDVFWREDAMSLLRRLNVTDKV